MDKTFENILDRAREVYRDPAAALAKDVNLTNEGSIAAIRVALIDLFSEEQLKESEDERIRKELLDAVDKARVFDIDKDVADRWTTWLEKQKEQKPFTPKYRVGEVMRTKQEASEGITDGLPVIVSIDDNYYYCTNEKIPISKQEEYEFPPMNMKQKPAEWSEEDEKMRDRILEVLNEYGNIPVSGGKVQLRFNKEYMWLRHLCERFRPQPHWKPSEEQMRAVFDASERNDKLGSVLSTLYNDLKKL